MPPVLNSKIWLIAGILFFGVGLTYEIWFKPDPLDYVRITVNYLPVRDRDIHAKIEALKQSGGSAGSGNADVLREQAINEIIEERLIEYQASLINVTPAEILSFIDKLKVKDVPESFKEQHRDLATDAVTMSAPTDWLGLFKKEVRSHYLKNLKAKAQIIDRSIVAPNP